MGDDVGWLRRAAAAIREMWRRVRAAWPWERVKAEDMTEKDWLDEQW